MNCGIEVLKRLDELVKEDLSDVVRNCERKVNEKGLSMLDIKEELEKVVPCQAVASVFLIRKTPYIAFIGFDRAGHYVLVESVDEKVSVFDPANRYKSISKFHFYMIWSKKAIIL